jgi:tRNA threonylcarbamoyladenosine biosynthesis protein TsaB
MISPGSFAVSGRAEDVIRVLAFDTSTDSGSVALVDHDRIRGEYLFSGAQAHSERLLAMIDRLLADSACSLADIDLLAVSLGPGSFTGLRVGISTAQGLALAAGKDLLGVPTLEAIAFQARGYWEQICPMITARGQEIFTGLYRCPDQGDLQQVRAETVTDPEPWLSGISGDTVFVGSGAVLHRETITALLGERARVLPYLAGLPRASSVAALAQCRYQGAAAHATAAMAPRYIRPPGAELPGGKNGGNSQPGTGGVAGASGGKS